jgi:hypothetical protein
MRKGFAIGLTLLLFASCTPHDDPFFGRWTVDKVNVDFDADWATPEMVRQFGSMEKDNIILISNDSVLTLVMESDTMQGKCSLQGTRIMVDGEPWGWFEEGIIKTETSTPMGNVKTSYVKSNQ